MQKVAILADSIACLTPDIVDRYNLRILPIHIHFKGRIYRDGIDIDTAEAYRMLETEPDKFTSSPASPGEYAEAFREMGAMAEGLLCITLSSRLSTLHNVASLGRDEISSELKNTRIEVFDSRTAAIGEGLIITAAARAAAEGKSLNEVITAAEKVRDAIKVTGIMETIGHVYRTGRIPKITARIGSMLNIKPVFTVSQGIVHVASISRNKEQSVNRALEMMRSDIGTRPVHVAVAHADAFDEGTALLNRIQDEFNCVESWITDFSPVMVYATGTGVLAVSYYTEKENQ